MVTTYQTISTTGEGLFKDRGSKFIGIALPVTSEEQVKEQLEVLRKNYYDARHHCYAYVLGAEGKIYRANDDGEPNHSAGDPILGQIHSKQLTDTLVVVVRYFGGTKLGVSGLINAYKTAAELALDQCKIVTVEIKKDFELHFAYEATNEVMRIVSELGLDITEQLFEAACTMRGKVKIDLEEQLKAKIKLMNDLGQPISLKWNL